MTGVEAKVGRRLTPPVSTAFSTAVIRALAGRSYPLGDRRLGALAEYVASDGSTRLGDAFDHAFKELSRSYRNEYVFKNTLVSKLIFGRHRPTTASAALEFQMGQSIADLVVFNGTITTYEIKTDLDSFSRLDSQLADYARRSERVYVVTSDARLYAAETVVPSHVGLIGVRKNGALTTVRECARHAESLESKAIHGLLHQAEVLEVLRATTGFDETIPRFKLWHHARDRFALLPPELAHEYALKLLRKRFESAGSLVLDPTFPRSLRALAYATPLPRSGARRLLDRLNTPVTSLGGL